MRAFVSNRLIAHRFASSRLFSSLCVRQRTMCSSAQVCDAMTNASPTCTQRSYARHARWRSHVLRIAACLEAVEVWSLFTLCTIHVVLLTHSGRAHWDATAVVSSRAVSLPIVAECHSCETPAAIGAGLGHPFRSIEREWGRSGAARTCCEMPTTRAGGRSGGRRGLKSSGDDPSRGATRPGDQEARGVPCWWDVHPTLPTPYPRHRRRWNTTNNRHE